MNRATLRAEVSERALDPGNTVASVSVVNLWLDLAVRTLWGSYAWPWKSKTTALVCTPGAPTLVMPTDFQQVKKLTNTDLVWSLMPRHERWLQDRFFAAMGNMPSQFYCDGGLVQVSGNVSPPQRVLKLYGTPDAAYNMSLRYFALPALFATQANPESAYSCMPEDCDEYLMQWCLMQYARLTGDGMGLQSAQASLAAELSRLIALYATLSEAMPAIDLDNVNTERW